MTERFAELAVAWATAETNTNSWMIKARERKAQLREVAKDMTKAELLDAYDKHIAGPLTAYYRGLPGANEKVNRSPRWKNNLTHKRNEILSWAKDAPASAPDSRTWEGKVLRLFKTVGKAADRMTDAQRLAVADECDRVAQLLRTPPVLKCKFCDKGVEPGVAYCSDVCEREHERFAEHTKHGDYHGLAARKKETACR